MGAVKGGWRFRCENNVITESKGKIGASVKKERRYSKVKGESRNAARSGDVDMAMDYGKSVFWNQEA